MKDLIEELNDVLGDLSYPDRMEQDGTIGAFPYHAHLIIGGAEVQLYKASGNLARGDAGDLMVRWDSWSNEWRFYLA